MSDEEVEYSEYNLEVVLASEEEETKELVEETSVEDLADEVEAGLWGEGYKVMVNLAAAGHNCVPVVAELNRRLS